MEAEVADLQDQILLAEGYMELLRQSTDGKVLAGVDLIHRKGGKTMVYPGDFDFYFSAERPPVLGMFNVKLEFRTVQPLVSKPADPPMATQLLAADWDVTKSSPTKPTVIVAEAAEPTWTIPGTPPLTFEEEVGYPGFGISITEAKESDFDDLIDRALVAGILYPAEGGGVYCPLLSDDTVNPRTSVGDVPEGKSIRMVEVAYESTDGPRDIPCLIDEQGAFPLVFAVVPVTAEADGEPLERAICLTRRAPEKWDRHCIPDWKSAVVAASDKAQGD